MRGAAAGARVHAPDEMRLLQPRSERGRHLQLGERVEDLHRVARLDLLIERARLGADVDHAGERRRDESLGQRDADSRRAVAGIARIDVLAAGREVVADFLTRAREPHFERALFDAERLGRFLVRLAQHRRDYERGALARRQTIDDRGHTTLLKLPEKIFTLGHRQRRHTIGTRGLRAQRVVEQIEVDLGRGRQPLLRHVIGDLEQPQLLLAGLDGRAAVEGALEGLEGGLHRFFERERHPRAKVIDGRQVLFDRRFGQACVGSAGGFLLHR